MSYLALYRRYRPATFDRLIGQEHIVKTLVNQIETGRLGHAYLFTGTRGTGKTSCAKIFAKAVNCLHPVNGSPCGECSACKALSDPSNVDVIEIDAASNNGVNEIRDLREKVQYAPVSCKYKVFIVDEVHMLSGSAFNALLKTLEEPPSHAIFILATTEAHKIPATILSRCMRFDFRIIDTDRIASAIKDIFDEQGVAYENQAVFAIAKAGEGSMRDALSVADVAQSFSKGKLTYDDVTEILGTTNFETMLSFLNAIVDSDSGNALTAIDGLCKLGKSMGVLAKDVVNLLRDLIVIKVCKDANSILNLPDDKFDALAELSNRTTKERLVRILEVFSEIETTLKYSMHPRVVFETATVKACRPDCDEDLTALLARIKELESQVQNGEFKVKSQSKPINIVNPQTIKVDEVKVEEQSVKVETQKEEKRRISQDGSVIVFGKILTHLRETGREMMWNALQSVKVEVEGESLVITTFNEGDDEFLSREENKKQILSGLEEYETPVLVIRPSSKFEKQDALDAETERLKKIFGEDMIIIKNIQGD